MTTAQLRKEPMSIPVQEQRLQETPAQPLFWTNLSCRILDLILAVLFLVLALPIYLVVAVAIRLDTPGPIFFVQTRVGYQGREFAFYKFRSMRVDAEQVRETLLRHNEATGPLFKMRQDPRITRVGRVIRKYSLDELPQLIHVLRGQMSLVGPRPALPREVSTYSDSQRERLAVLPGLTGLWQVSGRSDLSFDRSVELDLEYIKRRSVFYNIYLLFRTVSVVFTGRGAY